MVNPSTRQPNKTLQVIQSNMLVLIICFFNGTFKISGELRTGFWHYSLINKSAAVV